MIKVRHILLVVGLAVAGTLPLSAGPAAADPVVGVGAHVGDVGVHVGVGTRDRHRNDRRYRHNRRGRYRWHGRYYQHRRHYRHCVSRRWRHHRRVCTRSVWRWRYY